VKNILVSIIIVNFNGGKFLKQCLDSLSNQTYKNIEIILVDNASTDGSGDLIERSYSDSVRLIKNNANYGYARANNIGIAASKGKYVMVLNNDTEVLPTMLESLVKPIENDEQVGMCAPKILIMRDHKLIDSTGMGIYSDGTSRQRGWLEQDRGQYDQLKDVLLPSGCAALYRKSMLDQIGYFDERFFAYCEDSDLGLRARLAGWKCVFVSEAVVYHYYAGYWRGHSPRKILMIERNRLLLIIKLFPVLSILKSVYYYYLRCIFHIYGVFTHKGVVSEYLKDIPVWRFVLIILRAKCEAISLMPVFIFERIRKKSIPKTSIPFLLKKYAVAVSEIALK